MAAPITPPKGARRLLHQSRALRYSAEGVGAQDTAEGGFRYGERLGERGVRGHLRFQLFRERQPVGKLLREKLQFLQPVGKLQREKP